MEIKEGRGKLFQVGSEQLVSDIDYKLYQDLAVEATRWWGEFSLVIRIKINEDDGYIMELEDGHKGRCYVKRLVNRVLSGIPARYVYRANGISPFE
jgi:hypothetical protein